MLRISILIFIGFLLCTYRVHAQAIDSIATKKIESNEDYSILKSHQFRAIRLIAPTLLITTGSVMHGNDRLNNFNVDIRDAIQADQHRPLHFDNYIQYAPTASAYILKACGVKSTHNYRDLLSLTAGSYLLGGAAILSTKHFSHILRPDNSTYNSFPSGHTFMAFVGAEILRREYGKEYPYIAVTGYTIATATAFMRIYNNRHWTADVLAGAGVGILSTSIAYWLYPMLCRAVWNDEPSGEPMRNRKKSNAELTLAPSGIALSF